MTRNLTLIFLLASLLGVVVGISAGLAITDAML